MSNDSSPSASGEDLSFYDALLSFFRAEAIKKEKKEGIALSDSGIVLGKNPPFEQLIASYHALFAPHQSLRLEQKLFQLFQGSKQRFLYRGLPRVYRRDSPREAKIQEGFADLPRLFELATEKEALQGVPFSEARGRVTLLSWVMGDGLGDFWCAASIFSLLKKKMPKLSLSWVALLPKNCTALGNHPDLTLPVFYEKEVPSLSCLEDECEKTDLFLQVPTYHPETPQLQEKVPVLSIGEYGFLTSKRFCPESKNRSMGLHFLEKGILIREKRKKRGWEEIDSPLLRRWVQEAPDAKRALSYVSHPVGGWIYFQAVVKATERQQLDLDFFFPDFSWFIQRAEENLPILFDLAGVKDLEIHLKNEIYSFQLQEKGRRVRLLYSGALSADDFQIVLDQSSLFSAVRGNQSFSEALAAEIPFYYEVRCHTYPFFKDLASLVENRLQAFPSLLKAFRVMGKAALYSLPESEEEWVDESYFQSKEDPFSLAMNLSEAIQGKDLAPGYQALSHILSQEHSFSDFICPFLSKELSLLLK